MNEASRTLSSEDCIPLLDAANARAFLSARYHDAADHVTEVGRGEWSVAYAFRISGSEYVIRFGRDVEDFEKDRLASAYRSMRLPIPRVIEIGASAGGYYAISERICGRFLNTLTEPGMRAVLPSLFATLDAAREADVSGHRGYGGWDATGDAPHPTWHDALLDVGIEHASSRIAAWREQMAGSSVGVAQFDEALDCLRGLIATCPNHRHLIHNDPVNRNIFVRSHKISGVIDWGCAMYGDFLYDLSWMSFSDVWYPAWRGINFVDEAERHYERIGLEVPHLRTRIQCYEIHIGLEACKYQAFRRRWADLEVTARRLAQAVESRA
jgi:hygromycin-B 4-O-kinase